MSMFNKYRDTEQDILAQDLNKLGTAGLSARQKGQQMGMAQQQAAQQGAVQQGIMNQQAMAASPQMQGAYAQQAQNLASGAGAAGATAGFEANQLSAQIAQQRDAQIKADLTRQAEETQERWDKLIDTSAQTGQKFIPGTEGK